jgi:methionine synthase I (cobalamin-dependent)/5,10-methylenetetrahydrofolate reductase
VAHPFLARLARGPVLADGAMGTMLYSRGVSYERCFDELNVSEPDLVQGIHREYINAGAELIETNTFGANRIRLGMYGLEARVRELNRRGVRVAREAREISGETVFVAGSIGPVDQPIQPFGALSLRDVRQAFREQVEALVEGGVDLLVLETFSDLAEITEAILAIKETTDLPVVAQMTFNEDGQTRSGDTPAQVAAALERAGADVIGLNCGVGPSSALEVAREMLAAARVPVSVQPNAGLPSRIGGRTVYVSTPEYVGQVMRQCVEAGAALIGGCCGTTPEHVRAVRGELDKVDGTPRTPPVVVKPEPVAQPVAEAPPTEPEHSLRAKLRRGDFVVSVELDPPRGLNPRKALEGAAALRDVGVDCINIGDSPMATVRMSALGLALLTQARVGVEPIIHYTPRDRNLMAIQSDLLGAHANGIRNVIAVTGDPPRVGSGPSATAVWDVDSIGVIAILKRFNQGVDWAGKSIGRQAEFHVACAVTPVAQDMERELDRLRQKIEAGADFVMSQPLWSLEQLLEFEARAGKLPIPHLLGILPLESHRHAELLHNEVPGMVVPAGVMERMRQAGERGREVGLELAAEFVAQARRHVQGIYVITSYGRYDAALDLVRSVKTPAAA